MFSVWLTVQVTAYDFLVRLCMLDYGNFMSKALSSSPYPILARLGAQLDMVPLLDTMPYKGEDTCVELTMGGTHAHVEFNSYV